MAFADDAKTLGFAQSIGLRLRALYNRFGGNEDVNYQLAVPFGASTVLSLPNPYPNPGNGDMVHPAVVHMPYGWGIGNKKYWMAITPYNGGDAQYENPSILCADTPTGPWTVPPGLTNPVFPKPTGPAGSYNSDNDLVLDPETNGLVLTWRTTGGPDALDISHDVFYSSTSADGVTWTPKVLMAAPATRYVSPSYVFRNGMWYMYATAGFVNPNVTYVFKAPRWQDVWQSTPTAISTVKYDGTNLNGLTPDGSAFWHAKAINVGDDILMLGSVNGSNGGPVWIGTCKESQGLVFNFGQVPIQATIGYRCSALPVMTPDGPALDLFLGQRGNNTTVPWQVTYTRALVPAPRQGDLSTLTTTAKSTIVAAINEVNAKPSGTGGAPLISPWGNGSDGDVVISGVVQMTRDMYYNNLTINAASNLYTNGYRVYVAATFTNNGSLYCSGGNSNGTSAGAGGGQNNVLGSGGSGNAATITQPAAVGAQGNAMGAAGGAGGAGTGNTGTAGGVASAVGNFNGGVTIGNVAHWGHTPVLIASTSKANGGNAGGTGGGDGTAFGGGPGGAGGVLVLFAKTIAASSTGIIEARGGKGGNTTAGNTGGGGGGGGGWIYIVTSASQAGWATTYQAPPGVQANTYVAGTLTVDVSGGNAGTGFGTGTAGSPGLGGRINIHAI